MPITLGENNTITQVQKEQLSEARDYLRKQLLKPSPNVTTIYNTVKAYVDSHPQLLQMVNNNLTLCQNAFVWGVMDLVNPTALTRQRYLMVIQITIGLLA